MSGTPRRVVQEFLEQQTSVAPFPKVEPDDGLADAVMSHLDDLVPVPDPSACEPPRTQEGDGFIDPLAHSGRGRTAATGSGLPPTATTSMRRLAAA